MSNKSSLLDWFLIFSIGAAWGASFLFIKIAAPAVGPVSLVAIRLFIASLILVPIFIRIKHLKNFKDHLFPLIFLGIFNASVPFLLFSYSALSINAGTMSVLNGTSPLFAFIISIVWLKLAFNWTQLVGILIGITGLLIFVGFESLEFSTFPLFLCLLGAFLYAFCSNYIYKLEHLDPTYVACMTLLIGTILFSPIVIIDETFSLNQTPRVLWSIFLLGFLCTGLAYIGFVILLKRIGPVRASTVLLIVPLSGMLWAYIFLGERITLSMLIGCLLILGGVGLTNFKRKEESPEKRAVI
tara:strand:- start:53 stop:946 length:894 start_codon:yes stop_codon:yes gene_type:complete